MYLDQVLSDLASRKSLTTEDLYVLNEALFNLPEQDNVRPKTAQQCFKVLEKIQSGYAAGKMGKNDPNFYYDFVGLLGTVQNQSFIKYKQKEVVASWINELVGGGQEKKAAQKMAQQKAAENKKLEAAKAEVAKLKAELQKYKELSNALGAISKFQLSKESNEAKGKGKEATGKDDDKTQVVEFFDPHFHIWDLADSPPKHDKSILFEPKVAGGKTINPYVASHYEAEFKKVEGKKIKLTGGVYVEAMSVCWPGKPGEDLNPCCIAEAEWCAAELAKSKKKYLIVASACLEAKNADETLGKLCTIKGVCGIRQILNKDPNWPRQNEMSGDLLDDDAWRKGFPLLKKHGLRFDMQINPHQFTKAAEFLLEQKDQVVILNHLGCWKLDDLANEEYWSGMQKLADLPNVWVKLSMLCYTDPKWRPNKGKVLDAVKRVIKMFGVDRCFFASNYPVDVKDGWPAGKLIPAYLSIAEDYGKKATKKLFSTNAKKCYGF